MALTEPEFLTTQEAADLIRSTPGTLNSWRCRHLGPPFVKRRRSVVYARADLLAWMTTNTVTPPLTGVPATRQAAIDALQHKTY